MANCKNLFLSFISVLFFIVFLYKLDYITDYTSNVINPSPKVVIDTQNDYANDYNFFYVKKSVDFIPYSKQDVMNIFYSILNNGYQTFTFYCPNEYSNCISDVEELSGDKSILATIGNFVHPYNNFTNIKVITDSLGEVNVVVTKMYTDEMINYINSNLDEIFKNIDNNWSPREKILYFHDYIINNVSYDISDDNIHSNDAEGIFSMGKVKCSAYTDIMAIFLAKIGVKNFKVATENHTWNALFIDGEWLNLDLTWDDPVVSENYVITDQIKHKFFLIDTTTLLNYGTNEHDFNFKIYNELKNN